MVIKFCQIHMSFQPVFSEFYYVSNYWNFISNLWTWLYLVCLKLRTTTYAELPWSLGLSLFPYFWHLQQLGSHSFLIFDIDSSWLTGFCFKKEKERKISFLWPKKTDRKCLCEQPHSSHTAATGSSLTVCMLVSLHATPHLWPESLMKNLNILAILGLSEPKWWE